MKKIGIILIVIGLLLTSYTAFTYFTKEKVVDLGNIEISRDKPHHLNWSPFIGIAVIAIGGIFIWQSIKKT